MFQTLADELNAAPIQHIGKLLVLWRPLPEREISQAMRMMTFDNFSTTDDHLMHIVGLARDPKGAKFYLTKNSGGTDQAYGGYVYLSRSFFRLKTTAIMINKNALPPDIREKLQIN